MPARRAARFRWNSGLRLALKTTNAGRSGSSRHKRPGLQTRHREARANELQTVSQIFVPLGQDRPGGVRRNASHRRVQELGHPAAEQRHPRAAIGRHAVTTVRRFVRRRVAGRRTERRPARGRFIRRWPARRWLLGRRLRRRRFLGWRLTGRRLVKRWGIAQRRFFRWRCRPVRWRRQRAAS